MEMIPEIAGYAVHYLVNTGFLLLALWVMIKIQKFQYNFLGLLGAAALAAGLDMIPHFGHFIAVPVLYGCLLKITREDMTGVVFTAGISYALVFVMNLFLLASLMGDLRASLSHEPSEINANARTAPEENATDDDDSDAATPAPSQQKPNPKASVSASVAPDKLQPTPPSKSPAAGLTLKGIIKATRPMAIIASGGKTYDLGIGESVPLEGGNAKTKAILESIEDTSVVVNIAGEKVVLKRP